MSFLLKEERENMRKCVIQHSEAHTLELTDGTDINSVSGTFLTLSRKPGIHTTKYSAVKGKNKIESIYFLLTYVESSWQYRREGERAIVGLKTST